MQGVGAIGLGALPRLRILLLAGNPDLDVPDVIETLAGRVPKRTPAELCADKHHQAAPVSTLEILDCATSQSVWPPAPFAFFFCTFAHVTVGMRRPLPPFRRGGRTGPSHRTSLRRAPVWMQVQPRLSRTTDSCGVLTPLHCPQPSSPAATSVTTGGRPMNWLGTCLGWLLSCPPCLAHSQAGREVWRQAAAQTCRPPSNPGLDHTTLTTSRLRSSMMLPRYSFLTMESLCSGFSHGPIVSLCIILDLYRC